MKNCVMAFLMGGVLMTACQTKEVTDLSRNNIIPKPVSVEATGSTFSLTQSTRIYTSSDSLINNAEYLRSKLVLSTGFEFPIEPIDQTPEQGIFLSLSSTNEELGVEGYILEINEQLITLSANQPAGIFRGIQTLRQILPNDIEATSVQSHPWNIATGKIIDYPRYVHRGSMLDVARHFFSVEDVKRYIDLIAGMKMNVLHLHLTDDQGWRIEIKSWPNLTTHGGKTEVGGGEGGFFTQDEYKEIVQYAADQYIMVIPEIDVPSHTYAALTSYPELNCDGKLQTKIEATGTPLGTDPYTGMEVGFCKLCTDKEVVDRFMGDVIRELAAMTPGPFLHMGGDESHATSKDEYNFFMKKVQKLVMENGKTMIGWEEIIHTEMDTSTVLQYWARQESTSTDFSKAKKVIMSPARVAYLDMKYDTSTVLGLNWAANVEVDSAYRWDPTTISKTIDPDAIMGIEAPLWSETIDVMDDLEYLMYPRIMGHAEIGWSPRENRNWDEYKVRLSNQAPRLKIMGIDYYRSGTVPWVE